MLGLDYSAGRPSGAAVRAAGFGFVVRYCGQPGTPKDTTRSEVDDMVAHGVAVALVFESTASRAGQGRAAGQADAQAAIAHQAALGIPASRPIYYAVDYDADPTVVLPYFQGLHDVAGPDSVYGSAQVVQRLLDEHLAVTGWQTVAWSRGQLVPGRALFQRLGTVTVDGIDCDVNEALVADFGQHPAPSTPQGATAMPEYLKEILPGGATGRYARIDGGVVTGTDEATAHATLAAWKCGAEQGVTTAEMDDHIAKSNAITGVLPAINTLITAVHDLTAAVHAGGTVGGTATLDQVRALGKELINGTSFTSHID